MKLIFRNPNLKPGRLVQWQRVVRMEGKTMTLKEKVAMLAKMARLAPRLAYKRLSCWRAKMRRCAKCPIYDRELKRCRPYTGHPWGCGCYTPFLALVEEKCWGDLNRPMVVTMMPEFGKDVGWNLKNLKKP